MQGRRWAAAAALFASAAGASACGDDPQQSDYTGPFAERVREALPRIEEAVGLEFKEPPRIESRSRDQVREFLVDRFNEERSQRELVGMEAAYKQFGLLPDTLQLRPFLLDLLTEQVVGYYDPGQKTLYVVEGASPELVGITLTHELVHALQDQYVNLDSLQRIESDNDRSTAIQAVLEGQATYEQMSAMLGGSVLEMVPGGWERVREEIRRNSSAMPLFATAPILIQEILIFPYLSGAEFVRRFKASRGAGTVPYGEAMPVSTEQVLHRDAYFADERDAPTTLRLPAPATGTVAYQNNLGEFETRLFLYEHLRDMGRAIGGAAGWDGDRYLLLRTAGGEALVWVTVWDTPIDAGEFRDALADVVVEGLEADSVSAELGDTRRYAGRERQYTIATGEIEGRPAVMYVDAPAGVDQPLIDLAAVEIVD